MVSHRIIPYVSAQITVVSLCEDGQVSGGGTNIFKTLLFHFFFFLFTVSRRCILALKRNGNDLRKSLRFLRKIMVESQNMDTESMVLKEKHDQQVNGVSGMFKQVGGIKVIWSGLVWCVILCCIVLCCVVLCCVVSCRVVLCRVVSCRRVVLCCVVLCCVVLCCVVLCCVVLCCVVLCCVVLCCVVLCCVVLCCVVLCCVVLCCVVL